MERIDYFSHLGIILTVKAVKLFLWILNGKEVMEKEMKKSKEPVQF
jgi:hypothetical protein